MRHLLTAPQVAAALGYRHAWFLRHRARLEADHGFPAPVDGCGMRWDPAAIEDWLDARRQATRQVAGAAAEDILIARARRLADAAIGGEAAHG
jgi:predicted DNA-binding transcriptional regulator AlpA